MHGRRLLSFGGLRRQVTFGLILSMVAITAGFLATSTSANATVTQLGAVVTFSSGGSQQPETAVPQGTSVGDTLVTYIETYQFAYVTCPVGSNKIFHRTNTADTKLVACVGTVSASTGSTVSATLDPLTQVSMVTAAFSGVSATQPVASWSESATNTPPALKRLTVGDALVYGEASNGWMATGAAPVGTTLLATVNDQANSQVAMALQVVRGSRSAEQSKAWTVGPPAADVTAAIALEPGGSSPPTTQPTSTTSQPTSTTSQPTSTTSTTTTSTTTGPTTSTTQSSPTTTSPTGSGGGAPTSPPALVCGTSALDSPYSTAPGPLPGTSSTVTVLSGNNASLQLGAADTTYWFAAGEHTGLTSIIPGDHDTYVGATGAVIDGQGAEANVFNQTAGNVTIDYLTVENYWQPEGQDVINGNEAPNWVMEHDTIGPNNPNGQASYDGYGVGVGDGDTLEHNCITGNSEGGFNASGGPGALLTGVTISANEITRNALGDYPDQCGCAAGGKIFWSTNAVLDDNYVHDNYGAGLWADFNNAGVDMSGNYIASNFNSGINFEASYNANLSDNTLIGNGWASDGAWPSCGSSVGYSCTNGIGPVDGSTYANAYSAIYVSGSGGDSNIASNYSGKLLINDNVLTDNFGGIGIFEDRNRFCGSPVQGNCTLQQANPLYYDNPTISTGDAVENGTTTITSASGFDNSQSGAQTAPSVGALVLGPNVPSGDRVTAVVDAHSITLAAPTSGSGTGLEIDTGTAGGCGLYDLAGATRGSVTGSPAEPYFDECNWNARNITVSGNVSSTDSNDVTDCTTADLCGFTLLWANEGPCTSQCTSWSPYQGAVVPTAVSETGGNTFSNNSYSWTGAGEWQFWAFTQGQTVSFATWQGAPYNEDTGSSDT